jgi:hypothetical protein
VTVAAEIALEPTIGPMRDVPEIAVPEIVVAEMVLLPVKGPTRGLPLTC